jgi:hypothetical protein
MADKERYSRIPLFVQDTQASLAVVLLLPDHQSDSCRDHNVFLSHHLQQIYYLYPQWYQRIGPQRIGPQRIGPQRIGPQRIGPQRIGPQRIGPQRIGDEDTSRIFRMFL